MKRTLLLVALSVTFALSCHPAVRTSRGEEESALGSDSVRFTSAIEGVVYKRPTRHIEHEGVIDSAALAGATIDIEDKTHTRVATVVSDSLGRFFASLEPGTHYLRGRAFPNSMFPHPPVTERVFVPEGDTIQVILTYDTGIR